MINYVYMETYGVKYISFSYFITKLLYSKIRLLLRIFNKRLLKKIFKYDKYLSVNSGIDILNSSKKIEYNNYIGDLCNNSFMELYNESIDLSICRINELE